MKSIAQRQHPSSVSVKSEEPSWSDDPTVKLPRVVPELFSTTGEAFEASIARSVAALQFFLEHPSCDSASAAKEGAGHLCKLMSSEKKRLGGSGRERLRGECARITLEAVASMDVCDAAIRAMQGMLSGNFSRPSNTLRGDLMAGISDLNTGLVSFKRRSYAEDDGICDQLVTKLETILKEIDANRKLGAGGLSPAERRRAVKVREGICLRVTSIASEIQDGMSLLPPGRSLSDRFSKHISGAIIGRDGVSLVQVRVTIQQIQADIRELKGTLLSLEGVPLVGQHRMTTRIKGVSSGNSNG